MLWGPTAGCVRVRRKVRRRKAGRAGCPDGGCARGAGVRRRGGGHRGCRPVVENCRPGKLNQRPQPGSEGPEGVLAFGQEECGPRRCQDVGRQHHQSGLSAGSVKRVCSVEVVQDGRVGARPPTVAAMGRGSRCCAAGPGHREGREYLMQHQLRAAQERRQHGKAQPQAGGGSGAERSQCQHRQQEAGRGKDSACGKVRPAGKGQDSRGQG